MAQDFMKAAEEPDGRPEQERARELVRQFFCPLVSPEDYARLVDDEKYSGTGSLIVTWGMKKKLEQAIAAALTPPAGEPRLTLQEILHVLYKGRTMVNFNHVPSVTRAIDWLSEEFRETIKTHSASVPNEQEREAFEAGGYKIYNWSKNYEKHLHQPALAHEKERALREALEALLDMPISVGSLADKGTRTRKLRELLGNEAIPNAIRALATHERGTK